MRTINEARTDPFAVGLFGKTRRSLLGWLFTHPYESFYVRELVRVTGAAQGAISGDLEKLATMGILRRTVRGNQVFYQAEPQCPIFAELKGIFLKTSGLADVIRPDELERPGPEQEEHRQLRKSRIRVGPGSAGKAGSRRRPSRLGAGRAEGKSTRATRRDSPREGDEVDSQRPSRSTGPPKILTPPGEEGFVWLEVSAGRDEDLGALEDWKSIGGPALSSGSDE